MNPNSEEEYGIELTDGTAAPPEAGIVYGPPSGWSSRNVLSHVAIRIPFVNRIIRRPSASYSQAISPPVSASSHEFQVGPLVPASRSSQRTASALLQPVEDTSDDDTDSHEGEHNLHFNEIEGADADRLLRDASLSDADIFRRLRAVTRRLQNVVGRNLQLHREERETFTEDNDDSSVENRSMSMEGTSSHSSRTIRRAYRLNSDSSSNETLQPRGAGATSGDPYRGEAITSDISNQQGGIPNGAVPTMGNDALYVDHNMTASRQRNFLLRQIIASLPFRRSGTATPPPVDQDDDEDDDPSFQQLLCLSGLFCGPVMFFIGGVLFCVLPREQTQSRKWALMNLILAILSLVYLVNMTEWQSVAPLYPASYLIPKDLHATTIIEKAPRDRGSLNVTVNSGVSWDPVNELFWTFDDPDTIAQSWSYVTLGKTYVDDAKMKYVDSSLSVSVSLNNSNVVRTDQTRNSYFGPSNVQSIINQNMATVQNGDATLPTSDSSVYINSVLFRPSGTVKFRVEYGWGSPTILQPQDLNETVPAIAFPAEQYSDLMECCGAACLVSDIPRGSTLKCPFASDFNSHVNNFVSVGLQCTTADDAVGVHERLRTALTKADGGSGFASLSQLAKEIDEHSMFAFFPKSVNLIDLDEVVADVEKDLYLRKFNELWVPSINIYKIAFPAQDMPVCWFVIGSFVHHNNKLLTPFSFVKRMSVFV